MRGGLRRRAVIAVAAGALLAATASFAQSPSAQRGGRALPPLTRAADLASNGDAFVRLAEVHVQRADWPAAQSALERAIDKGQLKDTANAHLLMGVALLSQRKLADARPWFERAQQSEKYRQTAKSYLQLIDSQTNATRPK